MTDHTYPGQQAHSALAMQTQAYRDQTSAHSQQGLIAQAAQNAGHSSLQHLHDRIGPLHVRRNHWQGSINTHMPLAAGEVAELRRPATLSYVLGVLVDLGATLGFLAFVAFLLSRAGA